MRPLERHGELDAIGARWRRARSGRGGMVVVTGEAGAGKSTLVDAFVGDGLGAPVLWGACDQLSTPRPLGPVRDLAAQLGDVTRDEAGDERPPHEIFAAVFEQLRDQTTVLVIDDLHWADQATIDLLRFLLRRLGDTSSLVIGTLRDDEIGVGHPLRGLLGDVARSGDAITVAVEPLSLEAVTTLVGDRPLDPRWLHRITAGNAFFVVEMLDHAGEDLPSTVRDAVLARTTGIDDRAWDALHLLACAPEAIPDPLLAPLQIALPTLRELGDVGLIRRGVRGVAFRHDLCRSAIAGTVPPGGEIDLHRRMLDALEDWPLADPAVLVHHAVGAHDPAAILAHAVDAGRAAARAGAHTQAAELYAIALDQGALASPSEQAELLELRSEECYLTDRLDEAIAASERALRLRARAHDAIGVSVNHRLLSVYHWYDADRDQAERHADDAVAALDGTDGDRSADGPRGHAVAMQAYLAFQANDLEQARALAARARHVGGDDDPMVPVRTAIIERICDLLDTGLPARDEALSILAPADDGFDEIYSGGYSNLTYIDVEQRRLADASTLLDKTISLTIERDLPICRVWQMGSRGRLKLIEGDWDGAVADADLVLAGPGAPLARTWPHLVRGLVALRQGRDASADLDAAWDLAGRLREPMRLLPVAAALVERAWLTGAADDRLDRCRALLADAPTAGMAWARGELASRLRRLDPEVTADDVAEPYRLELAGDFDGAAESWAAQGAPYEQALALLDTGRPDRQRDGLDLLDRLGADAVAAWFRRDLRDRGVASVPARRRTTTRANVAGLTARQVDVLELLADGLTNAELAERLFISPKTADHHVSAILAKLGVPTRRDAVRAARELQILD